MSGAQTMSGQGGLEGALGIAAVPHGLHAFGTSLKMFSKYPLEGIQIRGVFLCGFLLVY